MSDVSTAIVHIIKDDDDLFFFSSRRRHTRYWRDWSSDVCSSDLEGWHVERSRDQDGELENEKDRPRGAASSPQPEQQQPQEHPGDGEQRTGALVRDPDGKRHDEQCDVKRDGPRRALHLRQAMNAARELLSMQCSTPSACASDCYQLDSTG